ncbi:MAG: DUF5654 family protein [Patescibacteria group bacterium]
MPTQKAIAQEKLHLEILKQMITLATSGFGLVAALAWNNVIQEFMKVYVNRWLPQGGSVVSLLFYAVLVTVFAVVVTYQLTKLAELSERKK